MTRDSKRQPPHLSRKGFTLLELVVTLAVTVIMVGFVLKLFTQSVNISRSQIHITDMQQSGRVAQSDMVRLARMAGRGGLPLATALTIRNNVATTERIAGSGSPDVLDNTDVLTVRGVFSTPLYQAGFTSGALNVTLGAPTTGTVIVTDPGPVGVPQDLTDLRDAITDQLPEAILLVSGQGEGTIAVVQLDPSSSDASNFPSSVMLGFTTTSDYDVLSTGGTYPPFLTTVSHVGILEEYRFYVEEAYESNGGDLTPLLRRDRYYPNTDTEHQEAGGGLADNVLDVQIAQGFDADGDGTVTEEDPPDESDEWMGNHAADTPIVGPLFHLRISTVAQTDRRTRNYFAPAIVAVEDRSYAEPTMPTNETERLARMFRRRVLVSSIDLRNLF